MGNIARILVADDLAREDRNEPTPAARVAADLAAVLNSEIHLVHIYNVPTLTVPTESMSLIEVPFVEEMQKALDVETAALKSARPDLRVVPSVEKGETLEVLLNDVQSHGCQLVVLGTHGRKGLRRTLLGSVAEEFMRRSSVPTLTVSPHAQAEIVRYRPRGVLVAVDLTEAHAAPRDAAIRTALDFARAFGAPFHLLHVVEEWVYPIVQSSALLAGGVYFPLEKDLEELTSARLHELRALAAALKRDNPGVAVEFKVVERAPSVVQAIFDELKTTGANLLVAGHRHIGRLEYALLGSVSRQLVRDAPCPVLTVGA